MARKPILRIRERKYYNIFKIVRLIKLFKFDPD